MAKELMFNPEHANDMWVTSAEGAVEALLYYLRIDGRTEHTEKTCGRFVSMMREMVTPEDFNFTTFPSTSDEMITLGPIPFYTLCAHHMVPFFGNVWVGYVPYELIAGLSKIPRLVKSVAKGLHVQEELTGLIADAMATKLGPVGVGVVVKAEHLCMAMRGVKQPGVITTTSAMRGVFADHSRTAKAEFLEWVRNA